MAETFVGKAADFSDGDRRIVFAGDHEIEVRARRGAQQLVTDRAANDPAATAAQGLARELEGARALGHGSSPSRW